MLDYVRSSLDIVIAFRGGILIKSMIGELLFLGFALESGHDVKLKRAIHFLFLSNQICICIATSLFKLFQRKNNAQV